MSLFHSDPDLSLYLGDVREQLAALPSESVHCVVTSPPYLGLRDYGLEPSVWPASGTDLEPCEHDWQPYSRQDERYTGKRKWQHLASLTQQAQHRVGNHSTLQGGLSSQIDAKAAQIVGSSSTLHGGPGETQRQAAMMKVRDIDPNAWGHPSTSKEAFCARCGAWKGALGLEPSIDLYVEHLVAIFREVRRVLRSDGVLWLNLGDSYAGSGVHAAHHANPGISNAAQREGLNGGGFAAWREREAFNQTARIADSPNRLYERNWRHAPYDPSVKDMDLMGVPWRVAWALQADWRTCLACKIESHTLNWGTFIDRRGVSHGICPFCHKIRLYRISTPGWWLRADVVWNKPNPMPESVSGPRWEHHRVKVKRSARAEEGSAHDMAYGEQPQGARDGGDFADHGSEYIDCPGCDVCSPNDGLVKRRGSWRPTSSHEYVFLLTKSDDYFCDQEAVRETVLSGPSDIRKMVEQRNRIGGRTLDSTDVLYKANAGTNIGQKRAVGDPVAGHNLRDVWTIATAPFGDELCKHCETYYTAASYHRLSNGSGRRCTFEVADAVRCDGTEWAPMDGGFLCVSSMSCNAFYTAAQHDKLPRSRKCRVCKKDDGWQSHFATFPLDLAKRCIQAGTPAGGVCATCGAPWWPVLIQQTQEPAYRKGNKPEIEHAFWGKSSMRTLGMVQQIANNGWRPSCEHRDVPSVPALVLDPFMGSGTVALAAKTLHRRAVGIDLNRWYILLTIARTRQGSFL